MLLDERDLAVHQEVDYDSYYRALDLKPGASLQEIEDRARLLRAAFHSDELPGALKVQALKRSRIINRATDELRQYWKSHATAPPTSGADQSGAPGDRFKQADAVATGHGQGELAADLRQAAVAYLEQAGHGLGPAEAFLDALADGLRDRTAPVPGRAAVDRPTPPTPAPGTMRGELRLAQFHDEIAGVVGLAGAERDRLDVLGRRLDQGDRGRPLSMARGERRDRIDDQPAAVLHQRVTHEAQSRFGVRPLAEQTAAGRVGAARREPPNPLRQGSSDPQNRRPFSAACSVLLKFGVVGLAIALAIWIGQDRADRVVLGASAEHYSAIVTGVPADQPAHWPGMRPTDHRPMVEAAPPTIHDPYANEPAVYHGR